MSMTFEQSKGEIVKLCGYFTTNRQAFLAPGVKEAHVRQSLIDPFFKALGWDVWNEGKAAPQYREVIPEDSLDIEGHQKAPDYAFRVGAQTKFFTEAKKCGENINSDPRHAYQLRRYGWSARVALSLLTDFEELGVYDCALRPRPADKASHARTLYFRCEEYSDRWRELWDLFSREAVWSGALDQYAASKRKRGTSTVDVEFLKEIEGWRDELARNIALRNGELSLDDLNAAIQVTIDRIVFLRMAEDRGIEPSEQLLKLCEQPDIYARFMRGLCHRADEKYNSGLFHFQKESGVAEAPDRITSNLTVDDKVFKPILQSLYFAHGSPYHFGVLPVEILGTVYERFLGKVIRLTPDHRAKVEEKPEVRKAGGVYYTPAYIVEYIVKQTVGKQIDGKSPAQLAGGRGAPPFRVLDMACGSGSFLLGTYQCLLDHTLKWYLENGPETHKKAVFRDSRHGQWRLTIEEKKRLLLAHVFGVDIDPQAVEVSKLSLLLKVLEGETDQTFGQQMRIFHERTLPNLSDNIKCGNSLIGPDHFMGKLNPDSDEMRRVNAFDWKQAFPDALKAGGFDSVVGNPPYIRIQTMKEWAPLEVEIYKERFKSAQAGNYDIYVVFVEQGLKLLNPRGRLGFICPHKFFNSQYGKPMRRIVAEGRHLAHVVHFGDQQVFDGATTYTCLLFLDRLPSKSCRFVRVSDLTTWRVKEAGTKGAIPIGQVTAAEWNFSVGNEAALLEKLKKISTTVTDVADRVFQGLVTGADPVFILRDAGRGRYYSEATAEEVKLEPELLHPLCKGSVNIRRYHINAPEKHILFPYRLDQGRAVLLSAEELAKQYPKIWRYLNTNKELLQSRERGKWKHEKWYAFGRSQNLSEMEQKKILTPSIANAASFTLDTNDFFYFVGSGGGGGGGYGITLKPACSLAYEYVLGLLNSKLLDMFLKSFSSRFSGGYYAYNRQYIDHLPIRMVELSDPADKSRHDKIVSLVDSMLVLHQRLAPADSAAQKAVIQRQIDATDVEIDRLVYDVYGLTAEEIAVVEGEDK